MVCYIYHLVADNPQTKIHLQLGKAALMDCLKFVFWNSDTYFKFGGNYSDTTDY